MIPAVPPEALEAPPAPIPLTSLALAEHIASPERLDALQGYVETLRRMRGVGRWGFLRDRLLNEVQAARHWVPPGARSTFDGFVAPRVFLDAGIEPVRGDFGAVGKVLAALRADLAASDASHDANERLRTMEGKRP